jgi:hypothetical protein
VFDRGGEFAAAVELRRPSLIGGFTEVETGERGLMLSTAVRVLRDALGGRQRPSLRQRRRMIRPYA